MSLVTQAKVRASELLEVYDHCKDLQKFYGPAELRFWIDWHWMNDLMYVQVDEHIGVVAAAFIWRLNSGAEVNGKVPVDPNEPSGHVAYVHFAYVLDAFRDKGRGMAEHVSEVN